MLLRNESYTLQLCMIMGKLEIHYIKRMKPNLKQLNCENDSDRKQISDYQAFEAVGGVTTKRH